MYDQFEIISFLHKVIDVPQDGRVQIIGKDVEWCLDIVDGRLLYAAHSLQYLKALETVLPSLSYGAVLPVYWRLAQSNAHKLNVGDSGMTVLNWPSKIIAALVKQDALNLEQAEQVLGKLTEDAVESLLGLDNATVIWHPVPKDLWHVTTHGLSIPKLRKSLTERLKAWQPLSDRISSPHQRPYCENLQDLHNPVPQGRLSPQMLEALTRLMQGASIRQLAQAVRQDEVKLAQLLYPYIQHRVIKLWLPIQPLARLPWLPAKPRPALASNNRAEPKMTTNTPPPSTAIVVADKETSPVPTPTGRQSAPPTVEQLKHQYLGSNGLAQRSSPDVQSRFLIVCIDDSQAMLEKIESYLDPERFELKAIINPVASVSKICAMQPDLVLMDVSMPSINGNSLCKILKRSYMFKNVPIIMISSNASPLNKATAESAGATDYLEKPFSQAQLMRVLETYLET